MNTNRPIKFRFWDPVVRRMLFPGSNGHITDEWAGYSYVLQPNGRVYETEWDDWQGTNFIPLQFTGLLDKNGREIYEGDVVQGTRDYHWWTNRTFDPKEPNVTLAGSTFRMLVEWNAESSGFDPFRTANENINDSTCSEESAEQVAVIGNIYENPELAL